MMHETQIINDIKKGIDRYEELVRRYHVGLIIHCERLVGDRDDAEDIAQEAFVKAYLQIKSYDPAHGRFSTWLYKIATNTAIDFLRKHQRKVVVEDIERLAATTMPDPIRQETLKEIRQKVSGLTPPEYRVVIESYYWHGKSYAQIAKDLKVPINTVRTWLRRAKTILKEQLL